MSTTTSQQMQNAQAADKSIVDNQQGKSSYEENHSMKEKIIALRMEAYTKLIHDTHLSPEETAKVSASLKELQVELNEIMQSRKQDKGSVNAKRLQKRANSRSKSWQANANEQQQMSEYQ